MSLREQEQLYLDHNCAVCGTGCTSKNPITPEIQVWISSLPPGDEPGQLGGEICYPDSKHLCNDCYGNGEAYQPTPDEIRAEAARQRSLRKPDRDGTRAKEDKLKPVELLEYRYGDLIGS